MGGKGVAGAVVIDHNTKKASHVADVGHQLGPQVAFRAHYEVDLQHLACLDGNTCRSMTTQYWAM